MIHSLYHEESSISRIFSLIERHAPRMMRTGGGPITGAGGKPSSAGGEVPDKFRRRITDEERARILVMMKAGKTMTDVARECGVSMKTVRTTCQRNGFRWPDGRETRRKEGAK